MALNIQQSCWQTLFNLSFFIIGLPLLYIISATKTVVWIIVCCKTVLKKCKMDEMLNTNIKLWRSYIVSSKPDKIN